MMVIPKLGKLFESRNIAITPYRISDEAWDKLEKQFQKE